MRFRDTLIDDLNAISPAKGTMALALLALGAIAMWQAPTLWPIGELVLGGTPFLIGPLQTINGVLSAAQSDRSVKNGPWQGGFMSPTETAELARNRIGLPLGLDLKSGTILRY